MTSPRHALALPSMSSWFTSLSLATCTLACLSCQSGPPPEGSTGELGVGKFSYQCVEAGDSLCSDTFGEADFSDATRNLPSAIAVGSKFALSFLGEVNKSGDGPSVELIAATPDDQPFAGKFTIDSPRQAAFLALNSSDEVVDYVLVEAQEAVRLEIIEGDEPVQQLTLKVGETVIISAMPLNQANDRLGGALPYFWSFNDADFVLLEREHRVTPSNFSDGNDLRLTGQKPGQELLRVSSGELSAQIEVTVK
jgi:hypothetical protein